LGAFKNNSEMTLAVEGARGPPTSQQRFFFNHFQVPLFSHKREIKNEPANKNKEWA
jgi:hypothetical protein